MATIDASQPSEVGSIAGNYVTDQEEQARKRTAIGLSPHRPTAPTAVQRPPDPGRGFAGWVLTVSLSLVIAAIFLLLLTRFMDPTASWPRTWVDVVAIFRVPASTAPEETEPVYLVTTAGYNLWVSDDFKASDALIPSFEQPGQVTAAILPAEGVYRMDVMADQIGWTLFDTSALPATRLETSVVVVPETPSGAVGLIGRFVDSGNFYLFSVDGAGQLSVRMWLDGQSYMLQMPSVAPMVHTAGEANRLALEDDGERLRFFVNQAMLFEVPDPQIEEGRSGISVYSADGSAASATFDWLAIYVLEQ